MMRPLFSILSVVYIFGIFVFAGSPIVQTLAPFNFCSLLHIPLYGTLTVLLIFSFLPSALRPGGAATQRRNAPKNSTASINGFMIAAFIALGVAIADEIYQSFVPGRDASITDILLDTIGIVAAMLLVNQFYKKQNFLIVPRKE